MDHGNVHAVDLGNVHAADLDNVTPQTSGTDLRNVTP
ncbi:hypothetical protein SAMN04490356_2617 [Streptomyces melanosporofaciens]|uniref:Uncharacterized protein n=1 Tax=Streptomyces melanosporofaciens TaxID=67327 RepID=A0A1H4P6I8_STRMJ|nr:hypothetical protein SAMN04490356_2617 [Streptomyces melanosporofaciens]